MKNNVERCISSLLLGGGLLVSTSLLVTGCSSDKIIPDIIDASDNTDVNKKPPKTSDDDVTGEDKVKDSDKDGSDKVTSPEKTDPEVDTGNNTDVSSNKKSSKSLYEAIGVAKVNNSYKGIARLGVLQNAQVNVISMNTLKPIHQNDIITNDKGEFSLAGLQVDPKSFYITEISGGKDADPNGDGKLETAVDNKSTIKAIVTGQQIMENGVSVNLLTDAIASQFIDGIEFNSEQAVTSVLNDVTSTIIRDDLNYDGVINYTDLLSFDPQKNAHRLSLAFNYQDFYDKIDKKNSIVDLYHQRAPEVATIVKSIFGKFVGENKLKTTEESPVAALRFGVIGDGALSVTGTHKTIELNRENNRYTQAFIKTDKQAQISNVEVGHVSDATKLVLNANETSDSKLVAWEGCEQDANNPTVCYATPDKTKSVRAIFQAPFKIREGIQLVKILPEDQDIGLVITKESIKHDPLDPKKDIIQGDAVLTAPVGSRIADKMDAAIAVLKNKGDNDFAEVVVSGQLAKQSGLAFINYEDVARKEIAGIVQYKFNFSNRYEDEIYERALLYRDSSPLSVKNISSLTKADGTVIKPDGGANTSSVRGKNPLNSIVSQDVCPAKHTAQLGYRYYNLDGWYVIACVPDDMKEAKFVGTDVEADGYTNCHTSATNADANNPNKDYDTMIEMLDGTNYCFPKNNDLSDSNLLHQDKKFVDDIIQKIRASANYQSGKMLAQHNKAQQLNATVSSHPLTDKLEVGHTSWIVGYGEAIYLGDNQFLVDLPNGEGLQLVEATSDIKVIDPHSKEALIYQTCSKDLYAKECDFLDQEELAQARQNVQLTNGNPLQFTIGIPARSATHPDYDWLSISVAAKLEITMESRTAFDFSVNPRAAFYDFSSQGTFYVKEVLNFGVKAEGEKNSEKKNDKKEVVAKIEKVLSDIDLSAPFASATAGILRVKLKVGGGVEAAGSAKLDTELSYKQLVKWDVKAEHRLKTCGMFSLVGRCTKTKNRWFLLTGETYSGSKLKAEVDGHVGLYGYAAIYMGPAVLEELVELKAKVYLIKIQANGKFIFSAQQDPYEMAKQNGRSVCMVASGEIKVLTGAELTAKVEVKSGKYLLQKALEWVGGDIVLYEKTLFQYEYPWFTAGLKYDLDSGFSTSVSGPEAPFKMENVTLPESLEDVVLPKENIQCPNIDYKKLDEELSLEPFTLKAGQSKFTKHHELTLTPTGNLVVYKNDIEANKRGKKVWASNTANLAEYGYAKFQHDGNLVIYDIFDRPIWASQTHKSGVKKLVFDKDGVINLLNSSNRVIWNSRDYKPKTKFTPKGKDFILRAGESITNGNHYLVMKHSGNFVLYYKGKPFWSTKTQTVGGGNYAAFQADGNLVIYNRNRQPIWATNTHDFSKRDSTTFELTEGGWFKIKRDGRVLWKK